MNMKYSTTIVVEFTADIWTDSAEKALHSLITAIHKSIVTDEYTGFSWMPTHLEIKADMNRDINGRKGG